MESKGIHIAGTCHTIFTGTTWTGVRGPDAIHLEVCCGWCSSGSCYSYAIYRSSYSSSSSSTFIGSLPWWRMDGQAYWTMTLVPS